MIIQSILDNDLYKLTMQKAVHEARYGTVPVRYVFKNRRKEGRFNQRFFDRFYEETEAMASLALKDAEEAWLCETLPWLGSHYLAYLRNFRFNPCDIVASMDAGEFAFDIKAPWEESILWEVPLMALISELYFEECDKDWAFNEKAQEQKIVTKAAILRETLFADFGTRRRRSYATQDLVVRNLVGKKGFTGTSNVYLAMKYGVKPLGTMAHEWIMAISALESLRHANRYALRKWNEVYEGRLGIALPDTFGTDAFFGDFDNQLGRLFDGVRHDSGPPIPFADKVVAHYKKLGIDPMTKTIVFSDGLDPETAVQINDHCKGKIRCSFGIGTNFTNDFEGSKALNMVIKMAECDGIPVVKLGDGIGNYFPKRIGDEDALRVAMWTFAGQALDAEKED